MKRNKTMKLRALIEKSAISLADEDAFEAVELFPAWKADTVYALDERIRYGEKLYRCVQAHTSQESWTPDLTPALWAPVSIEEWPEWVQPTGAQDAYNAGDKVSQHGDHWISVLDANIWEPGVYGWEREA